MDRLADTDIVNCKIPGYVENTHERQGQVIWMREGRCYGIRTGCQQWFKPMTPPHPSNIKRKPPKEGGKKIKLVLICDNKASESLNSNTLWNELPVAIQRHPTCTSCKEDLKKKNIIVGFKGKSQKVYQYHASNLKQSLPDSILNFPHMRHNAKECFQPLHQITLVKLKGKNNEEFSNSI